MAMAAIDDQLLHVLEEILIREKWKVRKKLQRKIRLEKCRGGGGGKWENHMGEMGLKNKKDKKETDT